ncbi:MAG TPA: glycosyltransferase family 39 protein [Candidatus Tectomicrobia bacterium]|nr:glycosyltransferase family 39 protein [Candidatus Tectomicrobia bacterium]
MTTISYADAPPAPVAARRRAIDTGLGLAVAVALVVNLIGLSWGLPLRTTRGWELDGIRPVEPLVVAKRLLIDRPWNPGFYRKYPLGHYFVLLAATAPYVGYVWLTGGLEQPSEAYPFGLRDPETVLNVLMLIERSMSVLMGTGIVLLLYLTARRLTGRRAALCSALAIACSPAFIYYAHTTNVDTPSLFWCALGLFAFGRLVQGSTATRDHVLLGAAVGMAAATKEQTVGLFLLVPLSIATLHAQRAPAGQRGRLLRILTTPAILYGLLAAVATFVVATHLVFNWEGNLQRFRWRLLGIHPKWGADAPYGEPEVTGVLDALAQAGRHTLEVMNPALFVAGVVGFAVLVWSRRWARHFAVPLVSYLAFAVALFPFYRARFVMQLALVLAVFAGPMVAAVWRRARRAPWAMAAVLGLSLYTFAYGFETNLMMMRDTRYAAEAWLARLAPGTTVETYGHLTYLPHLPAHVRGWASEFLATDLATLGQRAPEYVVLSGRYHDVTPGSEVESLVRRLLAGDMGYAIVERFVATPRLGPRLIAGLSPEIVVLARTAALVPGAGASP